MRPLKLRLRLQVVPDTGPIVLEGRRHRLVIVEPTDLCRQNAATHVVERTNAPVLAVIQRTTTPPTLTLPWGIVRGFRLVEKTGTPLLDEADEVRLRALRLLIDDLLDGRREVTDLARQLVLPVEQATYTPEDLRRLLRVGRASAYRLAREIGVRMGKRLVVARERLEEHMRGVSTPRG